MEISFRLEILLGLMLLGFIVFNSLFCSCSKLSFNEGFSLLMNSAKIGYSMNQGVPGDIWKTPLQAQETKDNLYAALQNNVAGDVPLPEGEMDFFYKNKFDASCCYSPQSYSSSSGCACLSEKQMKYLNSRGGNNN